MITAASAAQLAAWTPDNEAALRQCAQLAAYGADRSFLHFWQEDTGNRLSVMDDTATLYAAADTADMRLFLTMDSTVRHVRTDKNTAAQLAADWGVPYAYQAVMEAPTVQALSPIAVQPLELRETYALLQEGFGEALPPFDAWYADAHHRYRHGLCRVIGVKPADTPLACAMTVAECDTAALIGAVTTAPSARGKGYASACVLALAKALQDEGKRVLLSPKNAHACAIYAHIGFTVCGEWGSVQRDEIKKDDKP